MPRNSGRAFVIGVTGLLVGFSCFASPQRDRDDEGVREAIRFEKAKQAAAERQARIEDGRERRENTRERSRTVRAVSREKDPSRTRQGSADRQRSTDR
ncbi:MAG: hypothetical protein U0Q18_02055 [Bryobacteraceae bacterium]